MTTTRPVPSLEQLAALTTAASLGSMGAASHRLGISQQAVSVRVGAAERLLGVAVLERSTTGVRPTAQGRLVLAWAEKVIDAARDLAEGVSALHPDRDRVVVAASNTVSETLLPLWAARLRRAHPRVSLEVRPGNSRDVVEAVRAAEVDLGFIEDVGAPRDLRSKVVAHDELVLVVPPDHPWAGRRSINREHLTSQPLVLREEGSGTRSHIDKALPEHAPPAQTLLSNAAVRDAVRTTGAPTILSTLAVRDDLTAGRLVAVDVRDLSMPRVLRAVWNPHQRPKGAAAELLALAADT